jgi:putative Holliday junction resolvase
VESITPLKTMGLDIGLKRTGVAVSDDREILCFPFATIQEKTKRAWVERVSALIEAEGIRRIVVGVPIDHHGEEGADAKKIQEYIALLRERFQIPVIEWDERYTTIQAERTLLTADLSRKKRKEVIDKVAASIILQSYLDSLHF